MIEEIERYHVIRSRDSKMMGTLRLDKENLEKLLEHGEELEEFINREAWYKRIKGIKFFKR